MFLSEPSQTPYDLHFQVGRIPVRIHPFFWLVTMLMGMNSRDAISLATWVSACFVSILGHELGHAIAMRYFGESARIVLYGMGGLAISGGAWGRRSWGSGGWQRRSAWRQIAISAAGPAAGFLLAVVVVVLTIVFKGRVVVGIPSWRSPVFWDVAMANPRLERLVWDLLFINIAWGMVNLLPILPLDGGQIARELLSMRDSSGGIRSALVLSVAMGVVMSFVGFAVWHDQYVGFMFGWLAVSNYLTLRGSGY